MRRKAFLIIAVTFLLSGCAVSREARINQILSRHPQWDQATVQRVADGRVETGMTEEMVIEILGKPWQVAREGRRDVWTYMAHRTSTWGVLVPVPTFFVYLEGGRVVATKGDQRSVVIPLS